MTEQIDRREMLIIRQVAAKCATLMVGRKIEPKKSWTELAEMVEKWIIH